MYRVIVIFLAVMVLPLSVYAGEPTKVLGKTVDQVIEVLKDQSLKGEMKKEERIQKINSIVSKTFNFREMAKKSLDKYWSMRTVQEQKDFEKLFRKLLEKTYTERIENYSDEKVNYKDEIIKGKYAMVKTTIVNSQKKSIAVNYKMKQFSNGWMVYDVVIDGVSLVKNYKNQFKEIITNNSYEELVTRLNRKVAS